MDEKQSMLAQQPLSTIASSENNNGVVAISKTQQESDRAFLQASEAEMSTQKGFSSRLGVFHQCLVTGAVLLLTAACGMPIGYSAVLLPQLHERNDSLALQADMGSWIASVHSLASPFGSFVSGSLMDRLGRLRALQLAVAPLIGGWIVLGCAPSHAVILAGRVIAGFAVGLIAPPSQVFLGEISEPRLRGILIGAPFVSYSLGILLVYFLGTIMTWRAVAGAATVLPALSLLAMCFLPESPVWLVRRERTKRAEKALVWLRGEEKLAKRELRHLEARARAELLGSTGAVGMTPQKVPIWRAILRPHVAKPLLILNVFNTLQILSGTYLVVFYAVDIISEIGGAGVDNMAAAVMTAVVRLVFTIICCYLLLVMKRRKLAICSGLSGGVSALFLGIYMKYISSKPKTTTDIVVSAVCILIYIAGNTGFMVLPGVMIGELLPAKTRGLVAGYVFAFFNFALFAIAKMFPEVMSRIGPHGMFILFGSASFVGTAFLYAMLPETKGKTLGIIEDYFRQDNIFWFTRRKDPQDEAKNEMAVVTVSKA